MNVVQPPGICSTLYFIQMKLNTSFKYSLYLFEKYLPGMGNHQRLEEQ